MELTHGLKQLITQLHDIPKISNAELVNVLKQAKLSEDELKTYSRFDHCDTESYGRQLIYQSTDFKILLMSWKPGDFTAIHNHGETQWGAVQFFGAAAHRLYHLKNNELVLKSKQTFAEGHIAPVCGNLTHMMGNETNANFTTLHIYGSNSGKQDYSANSLIYAPEKHSTYKTMGSAYINMKKELILEEGNFSKYCKETVYDYFHLIEPFYHRNKQKEQLKSIKEFQKNPERYYQEI